MTATAVVAITAKGQWGALEITTIVLVALLSNGATSRPNVQVNALYLYGAASLKYTVLYLTILATFITMLVNTHGGLGDGGL